MRKSIMLLMLTLFSFAAINQTNAFAFQQPTQHLTKSGKPDKRYNENKHLKRDGTPDMRYNTSKKAAAKKKN